MVDKIKAINEASDEVVDCRDMGHAWFHYTDGSIVMGRGKKIIEFSRTDRCNRCGCERTRVLEVPSMRIKASRMKYPSLYLGRHRISRSDARREQYERFMNRTRSKES